MLGDVDAAAPLAVAADAAVAAAPAALESRVVSEGNKRQSMAYTQ